VIRESERLFTGNKEVYMKTVWDSLTRVSFGGDTPFSRVCPGGRFFLVLLLALALLVSGCGGSNQSDDNKNGQDNGSGTEGDEDPLPDGPPPGDVEHTPLDRAHLHSIKEKFGVTETGTEGVAATFTALHDFLQTGLVPGNVIINGIPSHHPVYVPVDLNDWIHLGDWIELEGILHVDAYAGADSSGGGGLTHMEGTGDRLIVVGINSFQTGKGYPEGSYTYQGADTPPKHVVFQFQDALVQRRMNPDESITTGGYAASEMREYLVPVTKEGNPDPVAGSGNFLAGLIKAGVPEAVLWAPVRAVSTGNGAPELIADQLWLPTEREMFGDGDDAGVHYASAEETAVNQARLEYYTDNLSRVKSSGLLYWEASLPDPLSTNPAFLHVCLHVCSDGHAHNETTGNWVVPAFCVYGGQ
jgi:hypothetical protein